MSSDTLLTRIVRASVNLSRLWTSS